MGVWRYFAIIAVTVSALAGAGIAEARPDASAALEAVAEAARLLSRVHGADSGFEKPRRATNCLRRREGDRLGVLFLRRPLPIVQTHSPMKLPDLAAYDDAGVRDWGGDVDTVKTAAGAAKLTFHS